MHICCPQVYRTLIVWNMNYYVVLAPFGLLLGDTGACFTVREVRACKLKVGFLMAAVGIWAVWTLAQTGPGTIPILAAVSVRIRYFFIITFVLNILCASECLVYQRSPPAVGLPDSSGLICYKIWSVQSKVNKEYNGERSATSRALEIIIESGTF